jgi:fatty-acyl-CoA synthase
VFVPLNTRLTVPELQFIVGDSSPKVMVHDADLAGTALTVTRLCSVSFTLLLGPSGSYEAAIGAAKPLGGRHGADHAPIRSGACAETDQ